MKAFKLLWNTVVNLIIQACGTAELAVDTVHQLVELVHAEVGVMSDEAKAEREAAAKEL